MRLKLIICALALSTMSSADVLTTNFKKIGTLTTGTGLDAGTAAFTTTAPLVKVSCPSDAYVGTSKLPSVPCNLADAGSPCLNACHLADGGLPCEFISFSTVGQNYVVRALSGETGVSAYMLDAGVETCGVFEGRN